MASRSRSQWTCSGWSNKSVQPAPAAATFLERAAARGDNLGSITAALQAGILEALRRDAPVRPHALGPYDRQADHPPEQSPDPPETPDE